jgi:hypothetical protein
MKKFLGVTAFVLLFSIPAHAQTRGGGVSAGGGGNSPSSSGGGGIGGGSIGGNVSRLSIYPRATFDVSAVSGSDPSFAPSTFLSFEQAVAEGKAINAANQKSLAEAAAENSAAQKAKAKFAFVQDANGKVVPAARQ